MKKKKSKGFVSNHSILKLGVKKYWKIQLIRFLTRVIGGSFLLILLMCIINLIFTGSIGVANSVIRIQGYFEIIMFIWLVVSWFITISSNEEKFEKYGNIVNQGSIIVVGIIGTLLIGLMNARDIGYKKCKIEAEGCHNRIYVQYQEECVNNNSWIMDNEKCSRIYYSCPSGFTCIKPLWLNSIY